MHILPLLIVAGVVVQNIGATGVIYNTCSIDSGSSSAKTCSTSPSITNMLGTCPTAQPGELCGITCKQGYIPAYSKSGNWFSPGPVCSSNGQWTNLPHCVPACAGESSWTPGGCNTSKLCDHFCSTEDDGLDCTGPACRYDKTCGSNPTITIELQITLFRVSWSLSYVPSTAWVGIYKPGETNHYNFLAARSVDSPTSFVDIGISDFASVGYYQTNAAGYSKLDHDLEARLFLDAGLTAPIATSRMCGGLSGCVAPKGNSYTTSPFLTGQDSTIVAYNIQEDQFDRYLPDACLATGCTCDLMDMDLCPDKCNNPACAWANYRCQCKNPPALTSLNANGPWTCVDWKKLQHYGSVVSTDRYFDHAVVCTANCAEGYTAFDPQGNVLTVATTSCSGNRASGTWTSSMCYKRCTDDPPFDVNNGVIINATRLSCSGTQTANRHNSVCTDYACDNSFVKNPKAGWKCKNGYWDPLIAPNKFCLPPTKTSTTTRSATATRTSSASPTEPTTCVAPTGTFATFPGCPSVSAANSQCWAWCNNNYFLPDGTSNTTVTCDGLKWSPSIACAPGCGPYPSDEGTWCASSYQKAGTLCNVQCLPGYRMWECQNQDQCAGGMWAAYSSYSTDTSFILPWTTTAKCWRPCYCSELTSTYAQCVNTSAIVAHGFAPSMVCINSTQATGTRAPYCYDGEWVNHDTTAAVLTPFTCIPPADPIVNPRQNCSTSDLLGLLFSLKNSSLSTYSAAIAQSYWPFDKTFTITCDPGFQPSTTVQVTCTQAAGWVTSGACAIQQCPTLSFMQVNNASTSWSCSNIGIGKYCEVKCAAGFAPYFEKTGSFVFGALCAVGGTWTNVPECRKVCPCKDDNTCQTSGCQGGTAGACQGPACRLCDLPEANVAIYPAIATVVGSASSDLTSNKWVSFSSVINGNTAANWSLGKYGFESVNLPLVEVGEAFYGAHDVEVRVYHDLLPIPLKSARMCEPIRSCAALQPVLTADPKVTPSAACIATGCKCRFFGDGVCDPSCNNAECNYDNGDCTCATPTSNYNCPSGALVPGTQCTATNSCPANNVASPASTTITCTKKENCKPYVEKQQDWVAVGSSFSCLKPCTAPSAGQLPDGTWSCSSGTSGSTCAFTCNSGFRTSGTTTCTDGAWSYGSLCIPSCSGMAACDAGWTLYDGRCYNYTNLWQSFDDASDSCEALGGGLVTLYSTTQMDWLISNFLTPNKAWAWLGVDHLDDYTSGWYWSDLTPFTDALDRRSGFPNMQRRMVLAGDRNYYSANRTQPFAVLCYKASWHCPVQNPATTDPPCTYCDTVGLAYGTNCGSRDMYKQAQCSVKTGRTVQWVVTNPFAVCTRPDLESQVSNAQAVAGTAYFFRKGDTAQLACDDWYVPTGSTTATCTGEGWSTTLVCQPPCESNPPVRGYSSAAPCITNTTKVRYNERCDAFQCKADWKLSQMTSKWCPGKPLCNRPQFSPDAMGLAVPWSPQQWSETPYCFQSCSVSDMQYATNCGGKTTVAHGDRCSAPTCKSGFIATGIMPYCFDGRWVRHASDTTQQYPLDVCEPALGCSWPSLYSSTPWMVISTKGVFNPPSALTCDQMVPHGTSLSPVCNTGLTASGSAMCMYGQWLPVNLACTRPPGTCPAQSVPNAKAGCPLGAKGSQCVVQCNDGYVPIWDNCVDNMCTALSWGGYCDGTSWTNLPRCVEACYEAGQCAYMPANRQLCDGVCADITGDFNCGGPSCDWDNGMCSAPTLTGIDAVLGRVFFKFTSSRILPSRAWVGIFNKGETDNYKWLSRSVVNPMTVPNTAPVTYGVAMDIASFMDGPPLTWDTTMGDAELRVFADVGAKAPIYRVGVLEFLANRFTPSYGLTLVSKRQKCDALDGVAVTSNPYKVTVTTDVINNATARLQLRQRLASAAGVDVSKIEIVDMKSGTAGAKFQQLDNTVTFRIVNIAATDAGTVIAALTTAITGGGVSGASTTVTPINTPNTNAGDTPLTYICASLIPSPSPGSSPSPSPTPGPSSPPSPSSPPPSPSSPSTPSTPSSPTPSSVGTSCTCPDKKCDDKWKGVGIAFIILFIISLVINIALVAKIVAGRNAVHSRV
eukprot:TRINITY_DN41_c0_g1_i4.p1 TRINITY_DN41_c0_g1~~TRINITY_DN41_c0_g1_i4.p1  ORF type:complete len:2092 (-),score=280.17 TRINITY_DN41_c0_g1_i4:58-6312(-)